VQLFPARTGEGIHFVLSSDPSSRVAALLCFARSCERRTVLRSGAAQVSTVEHLLAALGGLGIWDAQVRLEGTELPGLDGSAAPFVRALLDASCPAPPPRAVWRVIRPFLKVADRASCHLLPWHGARIDCSIRFAQPSIGRQHATFSDRREDLFISRFAPARTFGLRNEAQQLVRRGLARGATLRSVVVFDRDRVLNPGGTRFVDEPVRHKLVDALGDLTLLGGPLEARVRLERASHRLVIATLRQAVATGALQLCRCHSGCTPDRTP